MSVVSALAKALADVRRPGDFFTCGVFDWRAPAISVEGVGEIALPLLEEQAKRMIEVAQFSPFGRREKTVVDPAVRNSREIDAKRVTIAGGRWREALAGVVARAAEGLGVEGEVEAAFYKLLIYEPGGFFLDHRDTEKQKGMFATLVIAPPGRCAGGDLVVRHGEREARLGLHSADPAEAAFAAFYADCPHEVRPVEQGFRLVLVYNLIRKGHALRPPDYSEQAAVLAKALESWSAAEPELKKVVYPLEHAYTPAELSFAALKGADQAAARTLAVAARQAACDLHLALLTIEDSGAAEYSEDYRGRGEEEFEAGEEFDRSTTLEDWRTVADAAADLPRMDVEGEELSPPGALEDIEPDEEYFGEATGNAGATFERTYRRAALVLWPSERILSVIAEADVNVALTRLEALIEAASQGADRGNAQKLARAIAERLAASQPGYGRGRKGEPAVRLIEGLHRLDDAEGLVHAFEQVLPTCGFDAGDADVLLAALSHAPEARRAALLERLFAGVAVPSFAAAATLLRRLADVESADRLRAPAAHLAAAIARRPADEYHWRPTLRAPEEIALAFAALRRIDEIAAARAAADALADRAGFPFDETLTPTLLRLAAAGDLAAGSHAINQLRAAVVAHLRARAAEALAAQTDWRRTATLGCKCPICAEFSRFLDDPAQRQYVLRAVEYERSHLEREIQSARCDVDVTTLKQGRPYSLVCVKNQASYQRRAEQRKQDLAALAVLSPPSA